MEEEGDEAVEPVYDDHVDKDGEVNVHPLVRESLIVHRMMTTIVSNEGED